MIPYAVIEAALGLPPLPVMMTPREAKAYRDHIRRQGRRIAKDRLRAVIAADREEANDGRWVPSVPRLRIELIDMGWHPGTVRGTRIHLKDAFRWEPRR